MKEDNISDDRIVEGIKKFDPTYTKKYFYGYCKKAYDIYNHKYRLKYKQGMDFYSLAHEYYIRLLTHDFQQLTNRPATTKLSTWIAGGFKFVVLDAIRDYNKEAEEMVEDNADDMLDYVRSQEYESDMMLQVAQAVSSHYHDRTMTAIAHLIFIEGYKQKEVAEQLHISASAVNQRYKKMMDEVVTPFIIENYDTANRPRKPMIVNPCYCEAFDIPKESTKEEKKISAFGRLHDKNSSILHDDNNSTILANEDNIWSSIIKDNKEDSGNINYCMLDMAPDNDDDYDNDFRYDRTSPFDELTPDRSHRTTPDFVTSLKDNEIFVFGSNLQGIHAGGASRIARLHYGAEMGNGVGIQGQSYAIPTMQGGVETIRPYVNQFIDYAKQHSDKTFLVIQVGCGIAGFSPLDIAPLFREAKDIDNIHLPKVFWNIID